MHRRASAFGSCISTTPSPLPSLEVLEGGPAAGGAPASRAQGLKPVSYVNTSTFITSPQGTLFFS